MPVTRNPRRTAASVTARSMAFSPGASPPPVFTKRCIGLLLCELCHQAFQQGKARVDLSKKRRGVRDQHEPRVACPQVAKSPVERSGFAPRLPSNRIAALDRCPHDGRALEEDDSVVARELLLEGRPHGIEE